MGRPKQQSIPRFDDEEQALIDEAMKIDAIRTQGIWVRMAALKWARMVIAQDAGLLQKIEQERAKRAQQ